MSAELAIPENRDVARNLPSATLFALEVAGQIATEILDERVIEWTEQGRSQSEIASEVGCSRQAVSKRQARLGITSQNDWREISAGGGSNPVAPPEPEVEVVDAEVVEPTEGLDPEPPIGHLPDFVAPDAEHNLRTVSLRWFQWGRDVKELLEEDDAELKAKSREDKQAIKDQADLMVKVAKALKGAL